MPKQRCELVQENQQFIKPIAIPFLFGHIRPRVVSKRKNCDFETSFSKGIHFPISPGIQSMGDGDDICHMRPFINIHVIDLPGSATLRFMPMIRISELKYVLSKTRPPNAIEVSPYHLSELYHSTVRFMPSANVQLGVNPNFRSRSISAIHLSASPGRTFPVYV